MKKDSILIFGLSALISAGIVGAIYYLSVRQPLQAPPKERVAVGNLPSETVQAKQNFPKDRILKCTDSKLGVFYTNASSCDEADLDNKLSGAQPLRPIPEESRLRAVVAGNPQSKTNTSRSNPKPDLRRTAKEAPDNLPSGCKFPVGEAAELERRMSAAEGPKESMWVENYCKWRCEVKKNNCQVPGDFFYYSYDDTCRYNPEIGACR